MSKQFATPKEVKIFKIICANGFPYNRFERIAQKILRRVAWREQAYLRNIPIKEYRQLVQKGIL